MPHTDSHWPHVTWIYAIRQTHGGVRHISAWGSWGKKKDRPNKGGKSVTEAGWKTTLLQQCPGQECRISSMWRLLLLAGGALADIHPCVVRVQSNSALRRQRDFECSPTRWRHFITNILIGCFTLALSVKQLKPLCLEWLAGQCLPATL